MYNLVYMAKPIYGGWVTYTAHLSLKNEYPQLGGNYNVFHGIGKYKLIKKGF